MVNNEAADDKMPIAWMSSPLLAEMVKAISISGVIRLKKLGGDGREEVKAVLGDKVLDVHIYQRLLSMSDFTVGSKLSNIRDRLASNAYLAAVGKQFVTPFMPPNTWDSLTEHEKGTAVEVLIARAFFTTCSNPLLSSAVKLFVDTIINELVWYDIVRSEEIMHKRHWESTCELARADKAEFCAKKSCAQLSYELANSKQLVATLSAELKKTQAELTRALAASRSGSSATQTSSVPTAEAPTAPVDATPPPPLSTPPEPSPTPTLHETPATPTPPPASSAPIASQRASVAPEPGSTGLLPVTSFNNFISSKAFETKEELLREWMKEHHGVELSAQLYFRQLDDDQLEARLIVPHTPPVLLRSDRTSSQHQAKILVVKKALTYYTNKAEQPQAAAASLDDNDNLNEEDITTLENNRKVPAMPVPNDKLGVEAANEDVEPSEEKEATAPRLPTAAHFRDALQATRFSQFLKKQKDIHINDVKSWLPKHSEVAFEISRQPTSKETRNDANATNKKHTSIDDMPATSMVQRSDKVKENVGQAALMKPALTQASKTTTKSSTSKHHDKISQLVSGNELKSRESAASTSNVSATSLAKKESVSLSSNSALRSRDTAKESPSSASKSPLSMSDVSKEFASKSTLSSNDVTEETKPSTSKKAKPSSSKSTSSSIGVPKANDSSSSSSNKVSLKVKRKTGPRYTAPWDSLLGILQSTQNISAREAKLLVHVWPMGRRKFGAKLLLPLSTGPDEPSASVLNCQSRLAARNALAAQLIFFFGDDLRQQLRKSARIKSSTPNLNVKSLVKCSESLSLPMVDVDTINATKGPIVPSYLSKTNELLSYDASPDSWSIKMFDRVRLLFQVNYPSFLLSMHKVERGFFCEFEVPALRPSVVIRGAVQPTKAEAANDVSKRVLDYLQSLKVNKLTTPSKPAFDVLDLPAVYTSLCRLLERALGCSANEAPRMISTAPCGVGQFSGRLLLPNRTFMLAVQSPPCLNCLMARNSTARLALTHFAYNLKDHVRHMLLASNRGMSRKAPSAPRVSAGPVAGPAAAPSRLVAMDTSFWAATLRSLRRFIRF